MVAAILVGIWYREIDWRQLKQAILEGGIQTAVVMLLVAASILMGSFLTTSRVPQELAAGMLDLTTNKYLILLILNVFFLVIGFFLHSSAAIILVIPIVDSADPAGRHRPDPFRPGGDAQSRHRPADAAGRLGADHRVLDRQGQYLGGVEGQHAVRRRAAVVLLLCTYVPAVPMFLVHAFYG